MTISHSYIKILVVFLLPVLFFACNPARKLKDDERLLTKIRISNPDTKIDKSDLENYIKQKPNRKIFKVIRFHLWLHNLVNEDHLRKRRIKKDAKHQRKNDKRIAKGKTPRKYENRLFGEVILDISEPPVIYDSLLTKRSSKQLSSLLHKKGYFINKVTDSVYHTHRKQAKVYYKVRAAAPYRINSVEYKIPDELLKYYVFTDTSNTLIKVGAIYDEDIFDKERERITNELNNNGYYFFTKDYIHYEWDSIAGRKVDLTMRISNFATKYSEESDSIVESPHKRFYINRVYIETDYVSKKLDLITKDTTRVDDYGNESLEKEAPYYILHTNKLRYKTRVLLNSVFIRKKELFQLQNVMDTYKRLQEIKAFKSISIDFVKSGAENLDCFIKLSPILKQSFQIETEGKNTSGNLGLGGSIVYQNRNLFRGAELLELKLKGSIEATKVIDNSISGSPQSQFNTVEIGPEGNIYIPRFLVPFHIKASKKSNPKTIFTSSYTYQHRPYYINNNPNFYTRYITNLSFGYTWKQSELISHAIYPLVINIVKVELLPELNDFLLNTIRNQYILNSFSNHLSTSTRYTFTYNEQDIKKHENFSYFRLNAESSGNILRGAYELINSVQPNTIAKDDQGRYKMFGVVYSQYVRMDADYRFYYNSNEINKVVFRVMAGIGKPFVNFTSLPFERSFFSGGANGIRAWQARTLGPGSYNNSGVYNFDQYGDGQLEGNIEYRFKMIKQLNGAVFVDAGNTWLRQPDASRPGGDFQINRFYKEIAVGSGIGIRADFNFFIIRFDIGIKIRDPQFDETKRWVVQNYFNSAWRAAYYESHNAQTYHFLAFNIGIGYPF